MGVIFLEFVSLTPDLMHKMCTDCCQTGRMCNEGKNLLHWEEGVTLHKPRGMKRDAEISPSLAVKLLDETLLVVLSAILPCLHAKTRDKGRKYNINAAMETFESATFIQCVGGRCVHTFDCPAERMREMRKIQKYMFDLTFTRGH